MSDVERRQYAIQGEIPAEEWERTLRLLGGLGLKVSPIPSEDEADVAAASGREDLAPGIIPYELDEITSPDQYLASEHLGAFWPKYKRDINPRANKSACLMWGVNMLAYAQPKRRSAEFNGAQRAAYADALGIEAVRPRSAAGFSDEYGPDKYGLWDHAGYNDAVIRAGSFISAVRLLDAFPAVDRPRGIEKETVQFFMALANKLEAQMVAETPAADT